MSQLLPLEEISKRLQNMRLHKISDEVGLSYPTLKKLADGEQANYTSDTLNKVSAYLLK